jgi:hypothetical protein
VISVSSASSGSRLDWLTELPRTDVGERDRTTKFDVTLGSAITDIEREMVRLDVDDWRPETAMPQRKTDELPYASAAEPDDSGVALRWTDDGNDYAIACDHYKKVRDNTRAIGFYFREKRNTENQPVTTGQSDFVTARLQLGDDDAIAVPPASSDVDQRELHEILEVALDADPSVVEAAYWAKIQEAHPDRGGSQEAFECVNATRDAMLDE